MSNHSLVKLTTCIIFKDFSALKCTKPVGYPSFCRCFVLDGSTKSTQDRLRTKKAGSDGKLEGSRYI